MTLLQDPQWLGPASDGRRRVPNGSLSRALLVKALGPFSLLQIGFQPQLFCERPAEVAARVVTTLRQALDLLASEEFDVIVLGRDITDAWPTTVYQSLAEAVRSTPVIVAADRADTMLMVRRRLERNQDEIISPAVPTIVLELIALAAVLRHRALAALDAWIS